jgi:hypothetical protein
VLGYLETGVRYIYRSLKDVAGSPNINKSQERIVFQNDILHKSGYKQNKYRMK